MTIEKFLLGLNLIASIYIFFRLLTYERKGSRFKAGIQFIATLMMGASGSIAIMIIGGAINDTRWPQTLLLISVAIAVHNARGNVAHFLDPSRSQEKAQHK
jgi:hypothetical protein